MSQILNLFVDGIVTTPAEAWELAKAEAAEDGQSAPELAEEITKTADALLPPKRAAQIRQLFSTEQ